MSSTILPCKIKRPLSYIIRPIAELLQHENGEIAFNPDCEVCDELNHAASISVLSIRVGKRPTREELMNSRAMSNKPTASATSDRRRAAPADLQRRSVSVVERSSREQAPAAKARPLLA